jgi:hypothetical protein
LRKAVFQFLFWCISVQHRAFSPKGSGRVSGNEAEMMKITAKLIDSGMTQAVFLALRKRHDRGGGSRAT